MSQGKPPLDVFRRGDWFEETLHEGFRQSFRADRIIYDSRTEHQRLVLFEHNTFGRVLFLDGALQTTEKDEFIYHEMFAHVPILAHGAAKRVLIIGGGDGGCLEEVLKHRSIESVTQVEIDRSVIDFAKEHLRSICGEAFEDPRFRLVIADGVEYVAETDETFDLVLVDSTDPIGPGVVLFSERFYRGCRRVLAPGGILVTQNGVPFLQESELVNSMTCFRELFADAACFMTAVPTYNGGALAYGWGSDDPAYRGLPLAVLEERFAAAGIATDYYTPAVHQAAFALPPFVARMIASEPSDPAAG